MKRKAQIVGSVIVLAIQVLASCSNTRFLATDQVLYTGRSKVVIEAPPELQHQKAAERTIESATSYKPNNALFNKRILPPVGLWIFHYLKPKGDGKLANWFYKSFSSEPVLVSQVAPELRCQKVESDLFNIGFLRSTVRAEIDTNRNNPRKAKIAYFVSLDHPYRFNSISFAEPANAVDSLVSSHENGLSFKTDDIFNLESIRSESERIASTIVEQGYYYFSSDYVDWTADTTVTPYRIDLECSTARDLPPEANRQYRVNEILVRLYSEDDAQPSLQTADTIDYKGIRIISQVDFLKPEIIEQCIYFTTGDLYSFTRYRQTLERLNRLGLFKFINLQFVPVEDSLSDQLDLLIELTPAKEINLDLEAHLVSKSSGFTGPGLVATLAHKNIARGANSLMLKLNGGFESQWTGHSSTALGTTTYNIGIASSMVFPRILQPFKPAKASRFILPSTSVNAGFEFMNKIQYYRMSSVNLSLGYHWSRSDRIVHAFSPIFINSVSLLKTTPEFDSIIHGNPYIRRSFEEQFIAGMKYEFVYDRSNNLRPNGLYLYAGVSSSGNVLDLVTNISSSQKERPYSVGNSVYAQFLKLTTDIRYYRNFHDHRIILRLYSGVGFPYGNSVVMPYVEQFYSGGANSLRAFPARTLGPGAYHPESTSELIDQTGDIKLEGNIEYRFRISGVLHGAVFLDAGNVWLLNKDENRPGAAFRLDGFFSQLAVGTGFGLRFDFDFFVLRSDLGFPLRRPYMTGSGKWVSNLQELTSGYVFNLAIGYPF